MDESSFRFVVVLIAKLCTSNIVVNDKGLLFIYLFIIYFSPLGGIVVISQLVSSLHIILLKIILSLIS
jgi:hypothetical protein